MLAPSSSSTDAVVELTDAQLNAASEELIDRYPKIIRDSVVDTSHFVLMSFLKFGDKTFVKVYAGNPVNERQCVEASKKILRAENSACKIHFVHPGCWVPVDENLRAKKTIKIVDNVAVPDDNNVKDQLSADLSTVQRALQALQTDAESKNMVDTNEMEQRAARLVEESRQPLTSNTLDDYVVDKQKLHETALFIEQYEQKLVLFKKRKHLLERILYETRAHEPNFNVRYRELCAKHGITPLDNHRWEVPDRDERTVDQLRADLCSLSKEINKAQYVV